jgi:hypothetical protein
MTSLRASVLATGLGIALAAGACSDDDADDTSAASSSASSGSSGAGAAGPGGAGPGGTSSSTGAAGGSGATGGGGASAGGGGAAPIIDYCAACADGAKVADVVSEDITEASGIAFSALHAGVFWTHNDSGDTPRFFAVEAQTGADLGSWAVIGSKANDWEDMARGPCPGGSCLFLGDIGNNAMAASKPYAIYRVPEPMAVGAGGQVTAEALPFAYPSGYPNSETLLVHPLTGVITLVTKVRNGPSGIFEMPMPLTPDVEATLVDKGTVSPLMGNNTFTSGDVHPQGLGVLLRTYTHTYFFAATPDQSVAEALAGAPCVVPSAGGGEAVGWLPDGSGWGGVPEGDTPPITTVACAAP